MNAKRGYVRLHPPPPPRICIINHLLKFRTYVFTFHLTYAPLCGGNYYHFVSTAQYIFVPNQVLMREFHFTCYQVQQYSLSYGLLNWFS